MLNPAANVSGEGVFEFSGGKGHELAETMLPLVLVSGDGEVKFTGVELSLGRGLTVVVRENHGHWLNGATTPLFNRSYTIRWKSTSGWIC